MLSKASTAVLFEAYHNQHGFVSHHINSYDQMIEDIPRMVEEMPKIEHYDPATGLLYSAKFINVNIDEPSTKTISECHESVTPSDCIMGKATYSAQIFADMIHKIERVLPDDRNPYNATRIPVIRPVVYRNTSITGIPVMVGSKICTTRKNPYSDVNAPYDVEGGYFIVNGNEKVVNSRFKMMPNRPYVMFVTSAKVRGEYTCHIRSCAEGRYRSPSTTEILLKKLWKNDKRTQRLGGIVQLSVIIPYFTSVDLPLGAFMRVLGYPNISSIAIAVATAGVFTGGPDGDPSTVPFHMFPKGEKMYKFMLSNLKSEIRSKNYHGFTKAGIPNLELMTKEDIANWMWEHFSSLQADKYPEKSQRVAYVYSHLAAEYLPHQGNDRGVSAQLHAKARLCAYMVWKLLRQWVDPEEPSQPMKVDEQDDMANKIIETSGFILGVRLNQRLRTLSTTLLSGQTGLRSKVKDKTDISHIDMSKPKFIRPEKSTEDFCRALSTGNFSVVPGVGTGNSDVSHALSRQNISAAISDLRQASVPLPKNNKSVEVRDVHPTQHGIIGTFSTPEGQKCGINNSLAAFATVCSGFPSMATHLPASVGVEAYARIVRFADLDMNGKPRGVEYDWASVDKRINDEVVRLMAETGMEQEDIEITPVFLNGMLLGYTLEPRIFVQQMREARREMLLPSMLCIYHGKDTREVYMTSEINGPRRPLIVIGPDGIFGTMRRLEAVLYDPNTSKETLWKKLLQLGLIEYISKLEERNLTVLPDPTVSISSSGIFEGSGMGAYTHTELRADSYFSETTNINIFCNHNQGPRTTYQRSMLRGAVGIAGIGKTISHRTSSASLWRPELPLVDSTANTIYGFDRINPGFSAMVAIMCLDGTNQEDSVILNKAWLDMGGGRVYYNRTYTLDAQIPSGGAKETQMFCKPGSNVLGLKVANYDTIEADGLPAIGTKVGPNDIIIGRVTRTRINGNVVFRDHSIMTKENEGYGIVQEVSQATRQTRLGPRVTATVVVRQTRIPQVGDKFSNRHAQKGTVGSIWNPEDLPFTSTGLRPDIIINPHCIPSRMTLGMLIEFILSMLAIKKCERYNGDAFQFHYDPFDPTQTEHFIDKIGSELAKFGINRRCEWEMYNGKTGEPMEGTVFMSKIMYQRLKQMSVDKMHSRREGRINGLTRQARGGRSKEGGLRIGEMEMAATVAAGASHIVQERMMYLSDAFPYVVCGKCGLPAVPGNPDNKVSGSKRKRPYCTNCERSDTVYNVCQPYPLKLQIQEAMGASIIIRQNLEIDKRISAKNAANVSIAKPGGHVHNPSKKSRILAQRKAIRAQAFAQIEAETNNTAGVGIGARTETGYVPSSPVYEGGGGGGYVPSSPVYEGGYVPSSPVYEGGGGGGYVPSSPVYEGGGGGGYVPSSPVYVPSSPVYGGGSSSGAGYVPSSPIYVPSSPVYEGGSSSGAGYVPPSPVYEGGSGSGGGGGGFGFDRPALRPDEVYIKSTGAIGTVLGKSDDDRFYHIITENGNIDMIPEEDIIF